MVPSLLVSGKIKERSADCIRTIASSWARDVPRSVIAEMSHCKGRFLRAGYTGQRDLEHTLIWVLSQRRLGCPTGAHTVLCRSLTP